MKVKVISLLYIFQVLYVLCFTWPRYQVSVYRTIGPLVIFCTYKKARTEQILTSINSNRERRNKSTASVRSVINLSRAKACFMETAFDLNPYKRGVLLAHLSRRLICELIVYPFSGVHRHCRRRCRRRCPPFSNIFSSETAWPIKSKFYVDLPLEGGTKVCINGPRHMTKMAAMSIYGKNL